MAALNYEPVKDIPDQSGKVFVITGGTSGIGKAAILRLLAHNPKTIIFTGRSESGAKAVKEAAKSVSSGTEVIFVSLDIADLDSVKKGAKEILGLTDRIDVLINNAGVFSSPSGVTKQGYEVYFGTNFLGPAALTQLLLPTLLETAKTSKTPPRIITVSSEAATSAPYAGILFPLLKTPMFYRFWLLPSLRRYAHSKLATNLYTNELSRRYPGVISLTIHPGAVKTGAVDSADWYWRLAFKVMPGVLDADQGSWNTLWAATSEVDVERMKGGWFYPVGKDGPVLYDSWLGQAGELWEWTEKELKEIGIQTAV